MIVPGFCSLGLDVWVPVQTFALDLVLLPWESSCSWGWNVKSRAFGRKHVWFGFTEMKGAMSRLLLMGEIMAKRVEISPICSLGSSETRRLFVVSWIRF